MPMTATLLAGEPTKKTAHALPRVRTLILCFAGVALVLTVRASLIASSVDSPVANRVASLLLTA